MGVPEMEGETQRASGYSALLPSRHVRQEARQVPDAPTQDRKSPGVCRQVNGWGDTKSALGVRGRGARASHPS